MMVMKFTALVVTLALAVSAVAGNSRDDLMEVMMVPSTKVMDVAGGISESEGGVDVGVRGRN